MMERSEAYMNRKLSSISDVEQYDLDMIRKDSHFAPTKSNGKFWAFQCGSLSKISDFPF